MVIGWSHRELQNLEARAWAQIDAAQRSPQLPCLLVPQPAHAVLAGEVAAALLPGPFGELPAEIVRAIQMHDTGWASSDAQQIQRLRSGEAKGGKAGPVSFVAIGAAEAAEAWSASVDSVEAFSKAGAAVVSRHFCLLAQQDKAHQRFAEREKARQRTLESGLRTVVDLGRWTAALGFCDLVSLYLLCGLSGPVEFPLAHPASPEAGEATRVTMRREGGMLRFAPETLRRGSVLSIQGLRHPVPLQGARAESVTWEVAG
jgi:hypothetical protein